MTTGQALGTLKVLALVLAIGLVPLAVAVAWVGQESQASDEAGVDRELGFEAREQAVALERSFSEAQNVTLLLAQNRAFRRFYERPGGRMAKIRAGGRELTEVEGALAYLERIYPGRVSEASFIDASGEENARIAGGRAVPSDRLSTAEERSPFFGPTEALAAAESIKAAPTCRRAPGVRSSPTPAPSWVPADPARAWCTSSSRWRASFARGPSPGVASRCRWWTREPGGSCSTKA